MEKSGLLFLFTLAVAVWTSAAQAQQNIDNIEGVRQLHIEATRADIEVTSGPNAQLSWQATERPSSTEVPGNLMPLAMPAAPVNPVRIDEILFIRLDDQNHHYTLAVQVPADWDINIYVREQGSIRTEQRQAAVSAWSARGDVDLREQQADFSVTAMDGTAQVDVVQLPAGSTSAITAWNGDALLYLADDLPLELRIVEASSVLSDLPAVQRAPVSVNNNERVITLGSGDRVITVRSIQSSLHLLQRGSQP